MTMAFNGNTSQQIIPIDADSYEALGGNGSISNKYTLPQATEDTLGGIKASEKTAADTAEVKIDSETGKLFVTPVDISNKADSVDLEQEVLDRQNADKNIVSNIWSNSTMNGGHFQNKITNNDGSYALLFNESDGGGAQYFNKTKNSLQFVGVNDGNDGIYVQMYAKDKTTNIGARLNVSTTGIYYTLRNNGQYTAEDEVAVKKDINDLNAEVREALSQIDVKIESIFHYKGTVATTDDLPKTGNVVGDVYNIASDGHNVAFDGTGWDKLSETIDLTPYMTIAAFNTAIANYYTKAQVDDKDQAVKNDIYGRIWSNVNNPSAGYFKTKYTHNNGSYALMFNETDGGGSQSYDKTDDVLSYVGTNLEEGHSDEANSINVQIYSKDKTSNEGVRINVNTDKAYYLKGSVKTNTANREIATLADIDSKLDNMLLLTYEVLEEVE